MKRISSPILSLVLMAWLSSTALGQIMSLSSREDPKPEPPTKITLHAMGESRPALRHTLLPTMPDLVPGNAAVHYGKVTAEQRYLFDDDERWEKIREWTSTPLEELRRDKALEQLQFNMYNQLRRASRCRTCDWQLPLGNESSFRMLLPEVQQLRIFGRFLAARARAEIAEGKYEDAIETLEIGYALGRHTAEGETFVNGLIGLAICEMMSKQVQELLQQPDAPNLYWALTRLPRPLIDMRRAAEAEMMAVAWSFPELQDAENSTQDAEYWRKALIKSCETLGHFSSYSPGLSKIPEPLLTAYCLKNYPASKQALIASGMDPGRVESMPVAQVVVIHTTRVYNELRDDTFKWFYVPFAESHAESSKANKRLRRKESDAIALIFKIMPFVGGCQSAAARGDRQIAVLRTLEALRIYGASHDGRLPESLDDVTEAPIPHDPYSGQPFKYTLTGDTAVLEAPDGVNPPGFVLQMEIRFAQP